jgi:hypothetical protein
MALLAAFPEAVEASNVGGLEDRDSLPRLADPAVITKLVRGDTMLDAEVIDAMERCHPSVGCSSTTPDEALADFTPWPFMRSR